MSMQIWWDFVRYASIRRVRRLFGNHIAELIREERFAILLEEEERLKQ